MPRRPLSRPHGRPDGQHHRELARLLARLIAARWRQFHTAPRVNHHQPRKGFTRHK